MHLRCRFGRMRGFTLVELLIVVAIIAILSVVVILVLNPTELLKQSRDSDRLGSLNTLSKGLLAIATDRPGLSLGTANTVYVSVPDSDSACANLGLPTPPTGWSYHCVTSANLKKVDGTGWLPVDLTSASFGTSIDHLPTDPTNATSSGYFFAYSASSSLFELTTSFESQKYASKAVGDGGLNAALYEAGSKLSLIPFLRGMVGYWSFDDANNSTVADLSGYGNTLNWHGGSSNHYAAGKVGGYAAFFGGNSDYLSPTITSGAPGGKFGTGDFTIAFWAKGNGATGAYPSYVTAHTCGCSDASWSAGSNIAFNIRIEDVGEGQHSTSGFDMSDGNWHFSTVGRSGTTLFSYVDGVLYSTATDGATPWNLNGGSGINLGLGSSGGPYAQNVSVDDLRIFNRALSASEIASLYSATR